MNLLPRILTLCLFALPARSDSFLLDFERPRDVHLWQVVDGAPVSQSGENPLGTGKAMEVPVGTHIQTSMLPRDWRGNEFLEFSYVNENTTPVSMLLVLADLAWLDTRSLWNQYNETFLLSPGTGILRVPLRNLRRGQGDQINLDLKTPLDLSAIVHVEMEFKGMRGRLLLDDLKLSSDGSATLPAAMTPEPRRAPTGVAVAPEKMLCDFENLRDLAMWEQRGGTAPIRFDPTHATHGKSSLKIANNTLIVSETPPVDWSGFEELQFDVFLDGPSAGSVEVMIGDKAWLSRQNYWNRYNRTFSLAPGGNTLRIPLADLFRGEPAQRNTQIPRNIDLDAIAAMSLSFTRINGHAYLDRLQLIGPGEPSEEESRPLDPTVVEVQRATSGSASPTIKILHDFEGPADLARWEVRTGPAPTFVTEHATHGARALSVKPGTLLATYDIPGDWSGYESLDLDVFHTGDHLAKVEVLIGDQAWTQKQTYWNRHNAIYTLVPGANTISIPVNGLYRGEAAARNRDIQGNLDPQSIVFMSLNFLGNSAAPALVLDQLRLVGSVKIPATGTQGGQNIPVPGMPSAPMIWCGFEKPGDLGMWDVRQGAFPRIVAEHASEGTRALRVVPGNLLATFAVPRDWSRFAAMEFDVFNPGERLGKLEMVVGDDSWARKQTYWNRHNAMYTLVPGWNRVSLPVGGLYRGEAAARNRDIAQNIHPNEIRFFSIMVHGNEGDGPLYLDHFRLTPAEESPMPGAGGANLLPVWGFDFGPGDQAVWPGFKAMSWDSVYSRTVGYGLEQSQARSSYAADTTFPSRLLGDYVWIEQGDFRVDLPNGDYEVSVFFEESGYWAEEHTRYTRRGIYAEGEEKILEDRSARGGDADAWTLFQDMEPVPGEDLLRKYFEKLFVPRSFRVRVADGQLNLSFWEDARWSTRVSAIVIVQADHPDGAAWLRDLLEKNLKELRSKAAGLPLEKPRYDGLPEALRRLSALVFEPGLEETVRLNTLPTVERIRPERLSLRLARGEVGALTLAVHPMMDWGESEVRVEWADASLGVDVYAVRHIAKRSYGDSHFQVLPWWLEDCEKLKMPAGITRQFWIHVKAGKDPSAGVYEGTFYLGSRAGEKLEIPLRVEVLPFELEKPDFSFSFFGMPREAIQRLADAGANALCGGATISFRGFGADGKPQMSFAAVDDVLEKAKRAGMNRMAIDYSGPGSLDGVRFAHWPAFFEKEGARVGISAEEAARRVLDTIRVHASEKQWPEWTIHLVDEPLTKELSAQSLRAIQFVKKVAPWAKTSGFYSFRYPSDPQGNHKLFDALDVTITKGYSDRVLAEARSKGKNLMLYSLGKNRFVFGPLMYRHSLNGIGGYVQWHASIIHGYQFLDLDGREPDEGVVMRTPHRIYSTLDLERCRLGIFDFRYLQTLAHRAASSGEKGKAALQRLDALLQSIPMTARETPRDVNLSEFRSEVIALILSLSQSAEGD